jgi:hypothetical protein
MSYDIFNIVDDWTSAPTQSLEPYRTIIQYAGTGIILRNVTDEIQIKFSQSFLNLTKANEILLLNYFNSHKGRLNAFWCPLPKNYFTATQNIGLTDTILYILDTTPVYLRGYERMYIVTKAGSIFYSKITGMTSTTMTIATPLGSNINKSDIAFFGKLVYCRFDQDEIELTYTTPEISECTLSFIELPKEYPV